MGTSQLASTPINTNPPVTLEPTTPAPELPDESVITPPSTEEGSFSVSSTSVHQNEACIMWDYDTSAVPNLAGFRIYDQAGSMLQEINDTTSMHVDFQVSMGSGPMAYTMTAFDTDGNESPHSAPYTANKAPIAVMYADGVNRTVQFDANDSTDYDGGSISAYTWIFGDGNQATGVSTEHQYAPGKYTVTLQVIDDAGVTTSTSLTLDIA